MISCCIDLRLLRSRMFRISSDWQDRWLWCRQFDAEIWGAPNSYALNGSLCRHREFHHDLQLKVSELKTDFHRGEVWGPLKPTFTSAAMTQTPNSLSLFIQTLNFTRIRDAHLCEFSKLNARSWDSHVFWIWATNMKRSTEVSAIPREEQLRLHLDYGVLEYFLRPFFFFFLFFC